MIIYFGHAHPEYAGDEPYRDYFVDPEAKVYFAAHADILVPPLTDLGYKPVQIEWHRLNEAHTAYEEIGAQEAARIIMLAWITGDTGVSRL